MPLIKRTDYPAIRIKYEYKRIKIVKTEYDKKKGVLILKEVEEIKE